MAKVKPFLRWAGSKRRLLGKLEPYWQEDCKRYIEPFMGSASLFFMVRPQAALLSDLNEELVETYVAIKEHHRAVNNALCKLPKGENSYYKVRSQDSGELNGVERAARFIYLNRYCFNGLYRTNLKGKFNVPYGGAKTGRLPALEDLREVSKALAGAELRAWDFEQSVKNLRKGDFIYLDPPYAVGNRRVFREYGATPFSTEDLERLGECLKSIDRSGGKFLVSYAMCKEALTLFKKWNIRRVLTQRNISGFAKHRRRAMELLISNCPPQ